MKFMSKNVFYKIVFDTNSIWFNNEDKISKLFNSSLSDSVGFIKINSLDQRVFLSMPEIVTQERIEQTLGQIDGVVQKIDNGLLALSKFGVQISDKHYKKNYKIKVPQILHEILVKDKVEVLKTPKFNQNDLVNRCLKRMRPFHGDEDEGFKDTLIWLTILDDAKKHKNMNYVLVTNNASDFPIEELMTEFKKISKGELFILSDVKALKQFLDEELDLNLKLKEVYRQIENDIKLKIGDIMVSFNIQNNSNLPENVLSSIDLHSMYISPYMYNRGRVVGYDFKNIRIEDINKLENNFFELRADLTVRVRYDKEKGGSDIYTGYSFGGDQNDNKTYSIHFYYDQNKNFIQLLSSRELYGSITGLRDFDES